MAKIREPRPVGGGICELPLGCGRVSLISEVDAERVMVCNWHSSTNGRDGTFYVKGRPFRTAKDQGPLIRLHRMLLCFPLLQVDHINRNGLDNRRSNLRLVTQSQNMANASKNRKRGPRTRLLPDQLADIQQSELTARELAQLYGVSQAWIHTLRTRKARKHA